jgi:hypothetical protein
MSNGICRPCLISRIFQLFKADICPVSQKTGDNNEKWEERKVRRGTVAFQKSLWFHPKLEGYEGKKIFNSPRDEKLEAVDRKTRKIICLCGLRPLRREYPALRKKAARIPSELGSWIEHLLRVKGITQKEIAREAGRSVDIVSHFLCGRKDSARVRTALCKVLGYESFEKLVAASRGHIPSKGDVV